MEKWEEKSMENEAEKVVETPVNTAKFAPGGGVSEIKTWPVYFLV